MSSIFKKVLHKKPARHKQSSSVNPDMESTQIETNQIDTFLEEKTITISQPSETLELPQLIVGVAQSVGIQRDHNEDSLITMTSNLVSGDKCLHFGLFIVADGMGGHENGEIASSVAVDRLTSHIVRSLYLPLVSPLDTILDLSIQEIMQTGVIQAHQTIIKEVTGSGTTLTAALILGDQMTIAHVGDSRAYMINPEGNLQLLTHDHSLAKRLEEIGQITADQASTDPRRNVLYRALGQGEPFDPDIVTFQLQHGTQLLLCTDGLWGVVPDKDMLGIIQSSPEPKLACQSLINLANLAGGPDNISAIIVYIP